MEVLKFFCSFSYSIEAVWTRFFPASLEISRLLGEEAVGEVKLVRAEFGTALMKIRRSVETELGGGALLDIGIYCIQFALMVFNGEKPECIQATGVCLDNGRTQKVELILSCRKNCIMLIYNNACCLNSERGRREHGDHSQVLGWKASSMYMFDSSRSSQ